MKSSSKSPSFFTKYRDVISVFFLLGLSAIFYVANAKETREHNLLDRGILTLSAPIQSLLVSSVSGVSDLWYQYVALLNLRQENAELRAVNKDLRRELLIRKEQTLENSRLRRLLNLREQSHAIKGVVAEVVSMSPTPMYRRVRINRGTEDGITMGAGVVNDLGVVGRVIAVSGAWADVMLLADVNCSVDIVAQRTRAFARVRGLGRDTRAQLEVEYLERTADVEPGDILITSGLGQVFPKGIEVGEITGVKRGAHGLYQTVDIRPAVNFEQLEAVLVLVPEQAPETASTSLTSNSSSKSALKESASQ